MKVYKLELDVDSYKSLLAKDSKVYAAHLLSLDGFPKFNKWLSPLEAVIDNAGEATPDIYSCGVGNILITKKSLNILEKTLTNVELLPVFWAEGTGFLVNVIGYSDCLDKKQTTWYIDKESGKKLFITNYQFHKEKISEDLLFKIEEDCFEIFCADKEDGTISFKTIIEENTIKGIDFELIWDSKLSESTC